MMRRRSSSCSRLLSIDATNEYTKEFRQQDGVLQVMGVTSQSQKMPAAKSSSSQPMRMVRPKRKECRGSLPVENSNSMIQNGLCGREADLNLLWRAYERCTASDDVTLRGCQELVLIRGHSGTGKSSLANSLISQVKQDSGFFLTGKFELTALRDPYAVFVSAFKQFIEQLLIEEQRSTFSQIREAVLKATGKEGRLLTDMFPSLEALLGRQNEVCDVSCNNALNRFQFVFCKFCRAISTIVPLVLFLDDLQWSDNASLDLFMSLLQSGGPAYSKCSLLVIGAYRDEGMGAESHLTNVGALPDSAFNFYLSRLQTLSLSGSLKLTNLSLQNLDERATNVLVAKHLNVSIESSSRLARVIFSSCHGNPFHAKQLLRLMASKGDLYQHDENSNEWKWDDDKVDKRTTSARNIDELFRQKLACLPQFTLNVLQHAACMGDEIDVLALATVLDATTVKEIEAAQHLASLEGHLVFENQTGGYRFAHDGVRQTVLATVDNQNDLSFQIGYRLWTRSTPIFLSTKLFVVANLLNHGIGKVTDQVERYKAAALNLEAGSKAVSRAAFPDACRYFRAGIEFLEGGDYWKDEYKLSLSLFNYAADAEVCNQDFDRVTELANNVFGNAHSLQDALPAHIARINALGQAGKVVEATTMGLHVARGLGEELPRRLNKLAVLTTKMSLRCRSNEKLLTIPPMENEDKLAAMHILTIILPYSYYAGSDILPRIVNKLVQLCLKYGMHKGAALGFVAYGWALCATDSVESYRLGNLAFSIVEKTRAREIMPRVHVPFYAFIYHRTRPLRASLQFLENAEKAAMETGDVEYATFALRFKCVYHFWSGTTLSQLESMTVEGLRQMNLFKQQSAVDITKPFLQLIHNLTGRAPNPKLLSGEIVGTYDSSQKHQSISVPNVHYTFATEVAFLFRDIELAEQLVVKRRNLKFELFHSYQYKACIFKEALICIAQARSSSRKRQLVKNAKKHLHRVTKWAGICQENFSNKQLLIEAELLALKPSRTVKALTVARYDESIEVALREGFVQEAALASELCGDYLNRQGSVYKARASSYRHTARDLYTKWGATEKASQLSNLLADESER